jgi:hypothetical protein
MDPATIAIIGGLGFFWGVTYLMKAATSTPERTKGALNVLSWLWKK